MNFYVVLPRDWLFGFERFVFFHASKVGPTSYK